MFIRESGRFLAFPLAGAVVWAVVGGAALLLDARTELLVLIFGTGAIFPLALGVAKLTGQRVFQPGNPYASLMGLSVLMVNVLWCLHFILVYRAPALVPLSVALALGLHWIIFGWIIRHPLGIRHTLLRATLCTAAFLLWPSQPVAGVAFAVVACYSITLVELLRARFGE